MKTKNSKNKLGKVVLIGAMVFAGSVLVACGDAAEDVEDTTDNITDEIDTVDTIDEPIDTFMTDPGLDTINDVEMNEDEVNETNPE